MLCIIYISVDSVRTNVRILHTKRLKIFDQTTWWLLHLRSLCRSKINVTGSTWVSIYRVPLVFIRCWKLYSLSAKCIQCTQGSATVRCTNLAPHTLSIFICRPSTAAKRSAQTSSHSTSPQPLVLSVHCVTTLKRPASQQQVPRESWASQRT